MSCLPQQPDTFDPLWLALLSELGKVLGRGAVVEHAHACAELASALGGLPRSVQVADDERPEVRNGALQTLFRIISMNGPLFQVSDRATLRRSERRRA